MSTISKMRPSITKKEMPPYLPSPKKTSLKTGDELMCSGMVSSTCIITGIRLVIKNIEKQSNITEI